MSTFQTGLRILRQPEIKQKTGQSRATVYRGIAAGTFPKPVKLGPGSVGWIESEVDQWIRDRIAERDTDGGGRGAS